MKYNYIASHYIKKKDSRGTKSSGKLAGISILNALGQFWKKLRSIHRLFKA